LSDLDLPVETPGAHQRLVEDVGPVGCRQDDDARVGLETVHLRKQLVERVFALVIRTHVRIAATGAAYCIDLIDKYYARSFLLGLFEQVSYTSCAYTYKHLDEVGA